MRPGELGTNSALSPGSKIQSMHIGCRGQYNHRHLATSTQMVFGKSSPAVGTYASVESGWRKPENPACLPLFWQFNLGIVLAFHKLLTKKCVLYFEHTS